jgi:hypothetical protein
VTAKIDIYLKSMERFGARAVLLSSDSHVMLKFAGGDRHATQTTPHDLLTHMVMAVATHGARDALDGGRETSFEYFFDGNLYRISVKPTPGKWEVMISPAGASPVEGPPPVTAPIDTVPDTVPPREHMAEPPGAAAVASGVGGPGSGAAAAPLDQLRALDRRRSRGDGRGGRLGSPPELRQPALCPPPR